MMIFFELLINFVLLMIIGFMCTLLMLDFSKLISLIVTVGFNKMDVRIGLLLGGINLLGLHWFLIKRFSIIIFYSSKKLLCIL